MMVYDSAATPRANARIAELEAENATLKKNYQELIMAVGKKFPGETRHETALKYIRRCESTSHPVWMATQTEYPK